MPPCLRPYASPASDCVIPLVASLQCRVLIEPDVYPRIAVPGQLTEGFEFERPQQSGMFGVGLGRAFPLLQAPNVGLRLVALDVGVVLGG